MKHEVQNQKYEQDIHLEANHQMLLLRMKWRVLIMMLRLKQRRNYWIAFNNLKTKYNKKCYLRDWKKILILKFKDKYDYKLIILKTKRRPKPRVNFIIEKYIIIIVHIPDAVGVVSMNSHSSCNMLWVTSMIKKYKKQKK